MNILQTPHHETACRGLMVLGYDTVTHGQLLCAHAMTYGPGIFHIMQQISCTMSCLEEINKFDLSGGYAVLIWTKIWSPDNVWNRTRPPTPPSPDTKFNLNLFRGFRNETSSHTDMHGTHTLFNKFVYIRERTRKIMHVTYHTHNLTLTWNTNQTSRASG
jgi:hypothetical protein